MAAAAPVSQGDYEWALARIPELEVDLASAVAGLERSQADAAALKDICAEHVNAYKRLQDQHERLRAQLRQEQGERNHLVEEQQQQISYWRAQLDGKIRECEALQAKLSSQGELGAMRMQVVEEFAEPYAQQLKEQKQLLATEQKKSLEAQRQWEMQKIQFQHREEEFRDEMAELTRKHRVREQTLERQVASLDAEVKKAAEDGVASSQLRSQLREAEAKHGALQKALREQEQQNERERAAAVEDLRMRVDEAGSLRSKAHELKVQLEQEERRGEGLQADCDKVRREVAKLSTQLATEKAKVVAATEEVQKTSEERDRLHAEVTRMRGDVADREQLAHKLKVAQEQQQVATVSATRAEARLKQLEEEQVERDREVQTDREDVERRLKADLASKATQLENSEKEKESMRSSWREREAALLAQADKSAARIEALVDELDRCHATHDDLQNRFREEKSQQEKASAQATVEQDQRVEALKKEHEHREAARQKEHEHREAERQKEHEHREAALKKELEHRESVAHKEREQLRAEVKSERERLEAIIAAKETAAASQEAAAKAHTASLLSGHDRERREHEAERLELREKHDRLQKECAERAASAEALSASHRKHEQRADALQAELAAVSTRLDEERHRWAKEADSTHSEVLRVEEQRRADAVKNIQEECNRQLLKQQSAHKKALLTAKRKRQADKNQIMELVKRVSQAQHERAVAVRVCEENKSAYHMHISQFGGATPASPSLTARSLSLPHAAPVGSHLAGVSPAASTAMTVLRSESPPASNRHELRAISARLDKHVEWLRSQGGGAGLRDSLATTDWTSTMGEGGLEQDRATALLSRSASSTLATNTPRPHVMA